MGKKWMKCALALVMIVAGLAGFLWEFTVVDNDMYTIVDTHYGNRIECHIESVGGDVISTVAGENADDAVWKVLTGNVGRLEAFYSLKSLRITERRVLGIEWLVEPILPKGYTVDSVVWRADVCSFGFSGEFFGTIASYSPDSHLYQYFLETYRLSNRGEWTRYAIGNIKVKRKPGYVTFAGVRDGICYIGTVNIPEGKTLTDWQIMQFGMRYALPQSWEVTLLVLVNVLRGLCLATAVAGVVWLVAPMLKRKKPVSVTERNS